MRKLTIILAALALGLLMPLAAEVQIVKAQYTPDGQGFPLASPINITSPTNSTYNSLPLLEITFRYALAVSKTSMTVVYSIDGKDNATLPVTATFVPIESTRTYANGTTAKAISIWSYYVITGYVNLPELPEGSHNIAVYGKYEYTGESVFTVLDNRTVHFTVNYGNPPRISNLSVENKTYNTPTIPLNFTVNKSTSWMGYSLDGQANVTITENITLNDLPYGAHTLTIYANDTVGNMGNSSAIDFTIAEPPPTTVTAAAAIVVPIAVAGTGLLIYFKKHSR